MLLIKLKLAVILPCLFFNIFLVYGVQKTNLSIISFELVLQAYDLCHTLRNIFKFLIFFFWTLFVTDCSSNHSQVHFSSFLWSIFRGCLSFALVVVCEPEIRTANIHRMPNRLPMLFIKRATSDHDTQIYNLNLSLIWIWICHF